MQEFASITLNKQSAVPVYRQLAEAFCELIRQGLLPPHRKLPPIRLMAQGLHINNDTVINAYKFLENKGVVYTIAGSGTYVSEIEKENETFPSEAVKSFLTEKATPAVSVFGFFVKEK